MDLLSPLYDAKTTKICLSPLPEPWGGYRYSRVQVLGGALTQNSERRLRTVVQTQDKYKRKRALPVQIL